MTEKRFTKWTQLIHCSELKPNDKVLLELILDYHNIQLEGAKWNNTSKEALMKDADIKDYAAGEALKRLEAKGLIKCDKDYWESADHYTPILANVDKMIEQSIADRKNSTNTGKPKQGRLENQGNQGLKTKPNTNTNNTKTNYSIYITNDNKEDVSVPTIQGEDIPSLSEEDIERLEQEYNGNPILEEANSSNPSDSINPTNQDGCNPNGTAYNQQGDNFNDTSNTSIASSAEDAYNPRKGYNTNSPTQSPRGDKPKIDRMFDLLQEIIDEHKKGSEDNSICVSKYNEYLDLSKAVTLNPNQQTAIDNKMRIVKDMDKRSPFILSSKCVEMQDVYEGIIDMMSEEHPTYEDVADCTIAWKAMKEDHRYLRGFEMDYLYPYFESSKGLISTQSKQYAKG